MPNSKDFWGKQLPAWLNHPGTKPSIFHPSAPNKHYGLLKRKHGGDLLRGKVLFFSMESDWRSGFECLLRHQGILQDNRFLLAFFVRVRSFERTKTPWYRYRGFKESLDIFFVFKCLGVDLRALGKIQAESRNEKKPPSTHFSSILPRIGLKDLEHAPYICN